jgi:hypothetical protein
VIKRLIFSSILLLLLTGFYIPAFGDHPVNASPEVQNILTGTTMDCIGIVTETDVIAWSVSAPVREKDFATVNYAITDPDFPSNYYSAIKKLSDGQVVASSTGLISVIIPAGAYEFGYLDENHNFFSLGVGLIQPINEGSAYNAQYDLTHGFGISDSLMDPEMIHYSAGYNEQTVAVSGKTTYIKSMALSTANKVAGESNIQSTKSIQFVGSDSGRIISSEDLLVDGSGTWSKTGNSILCPFGPQNSEYIPAFCNIAQAGSSIDMNLVSLSTDADSRFISADSAVPVALNYDTSARGLNTANVYSPASGSVSAFIKIHTQEARGNITTKSEDLSYVETSSANGLIQQFTKKMNYQSGTRLI